MIGLDTGHLVYNYGTKLQAYAMQTLLEQNGERCEIIQWHKRNFGIFNRVVDQYKVLKKIYIGFGKRMKYWPKVMERYKKFDDFNSKFHIHKYYGDLDEMKECVSKYSHVFCGSDQAWLPSNVEKHWYTLEFCNSNQVRAAYAPSFGVDRIEDSKLNAYKQFLSLFDYLSVREISGQKIIKKILEKDVPVVLDPTLLLERNYWDRLLKEATVCIPKQPYCFCYFLGNNKKHRESVKHLSQHKDYKIVNLQHFSGFCEADVDFADENLYAVSPQDFIALIANADYVCIIQSFGYALINDYSYYLMMRYRYKFRAALMVLPGLISVVLSIFAILFILKDNLYLGRIVPTTAVYGIFAIVVLMAVYSKTKPELNLDYLKYGLKIALPLVLHSIALQILSQSDRVMITSLRNAAETGVYSLVYNLSMIATVITTSLDGIWVPWFTGKLKERKIREINVLAMDYVHLMTYAMVALILVGPEILKIFADQRYWEGMSIIPPIALANYMIFMYTMYVYIEHYYKKTVYITKNTLIAAGLNVILNFILIPKYGYVAAAYTTLASYFVAFILHSRYAKKIEPDIYPLKMFALPLLHVGGAIILYYPLLNFWTLRWGILFVYLIIVLIKERFRIGTLVPVLAEKCSFFKEK